MATNPGGEAMTYFSDPPLPEAVELARPSAEESDGQLLQRVHHSHEADAFATLLQRHGPMVLAACRRVLKDVHLADDAFQETFLLLNRKAGLIAQPGLLSGWLYGVAYRTAMQIRHKVERQRCRETPVADLAAENPENLAEPAVEMPVAQDDVALVLDGELHRLPEKYRSPIVLCHLQGKTNQQAAEQLGWPKGTVQARLARGRDLLRRRLTRRGLALSAAAFLLLLREKMAAAAVPPSLVLSTIEASTPLPSSLPSAATSPPLVQVPLALGKGRRLFLSRATVGAAVALTVLIVCLLAGAVMLLSQSSEPAPLTFPPGEPLTVQPGVVREASANEPAVEAAGAARNGPADPAQSAPQAPPKAPVAEPIAAMPLLLPAEPAVEAADPMVIQRRTAFQPPSKAKLPKGPGRPSGRWFR
jgi:RNA polymerase sigma factor (sigma-70 family)